MKTIKVSFVKNPTAGTPLYTYKTAVNPKPGDILSVETFEGIKKVLVVTVDDKYDSVAEKRFNGLKEAYLPKDLPETDELVGVKRL